MVYYRYFNRRPRWRRWRRNPRRRRRTIFPWFRRRRYYYRRRPTVRRRYKKRAYISSVMQWHPKHRALCYIRGWSIAFFGVGQNTTCNFQTYVQKTGNKPGYYILYGGGASLYHLSLEWLYEEHLKRRNSWSHTNEGFDLARYFGTTFTLWPHPRLNYLFWWETDYAALRKTEWMRLHPANALLERNHIIMKSIKNGRRRPKKVRVKPPSVHQTQWYFMNQWCDVGLVRFGFTLFNMEEPFLKTDQNYPRIKIGSSTGGKDKYNLPGTCPVPTGDNQVWYNYNWDTATDNMIAVGQKKSAVTTVLTTISITKIDVPYWMWYFGMGWKNFNLDTNYYFFIWWYNDDKKQERYSVQELTDKDKQWILLRLTQPEKNTAQLCIEMVQHSPFCYTNQDLIDKTNFSLPFSYVSKWQWGGTSPNIETTIDPCKQPPTSYQLDNVRIGDPATQGTYMLHPWDLTKDGFITADKLQYLIRGLPKTITEPREEAPTTSAQIDSAPSSEGSSESESSDWSSNEEETTNSYHLLTRRIYRERRFRKKLRRRVLRLLNK
nr:MAG: ORF1 [Giant panda anellovirus]USZ80594.1 ORF1 [Tick-associated anellovirus 4]